MSYPVGNPEDRFSHDEGHENHIIVFYHLRNKFHFSEVHQSMNATGQVQSKGCQKGVTLTLHGTNCVHTSMILRKMKFISYIYTFFLYHFCSLSVKFWFKSCKINCEKYAVKRSYKARCLVITFNGLLLDITLIKHYVGQSTIAFVCEVAYA